MIRRLKEPRLRAYLRKITAVSTDYLTRVADPGSRLHPFYLDYRDGRIDCAQLIARLPHAAAIGDSLSTDVYISSALSTFWRARTRRGKNWFLDTGSSPSSVCSVFKRLEKLTPLVATEYGGLGAMVDSGHDRLSFSRRVLRTRNFSGQVSQLLSHKRFPDLILTWIGHNNVDWAWRSPPAELKQSEKRLQRLSERFRQHYTRQMHRLVARAQTESHHIAIVVYGLVNFASFFKAREVAEALREKNPKLYPYLEVDFKHFISMRPAYRGNLIRLTGMMNEQLRAMVGQFDRKLGRFPNIRVQYSDVLAKADLSRIEVIHEVDGWHPSVQGHNVFAEAAFNDLGPSLEFLGITEAESGDRGVGR